MPDRSCMILLLGLNSALYFAMVAFAGMRTGNDYAWKLAIAGVGFTYLCYGIQLMLPVEYQRAAYAAFGFSLLLGVMSGISLLWKS